MLVGTFKNDNEKSTLLTSYRPESSSILVTSNICRIGGQKDRIEFKLKKHYYEKITSSKYFFDKNQYENGSISTLPHCSLAPLTQEKFNTLTIYSRRQLLSKFSSDQTRSLSACRSGCALRIKKNLKNVNSFIILLY